VRRPCSLAEVAAWSRSHEALHRHLADFLDQFYLERSTEMLAEEPSLLKNSFAEGDVDDAYLAAVAVTLARHVGTPPPKWAWSEDRKLRAPWFASRGAAVRATLIAESPAAFRERNLFVSANALSRA